MSDDDLAAVEDAFLKAVGLTGTQGLQSLAKRRAAAGKYAEFEADPAANQAPAAGAGLAPDVPSS